MTVPRMSRDKLKRITEKELKREMIKLVGVFGWPGTPGNENGFSDTFFETWWEVFEPYTYKQVKKAVSAHINADDSLKGVFPLPGRIKKLITYDEDEHRILNEAAEKREKELNRINMTYEECVRQMKLEAENNHVK